MYDLIITLFLQDIHQMHIQNSIEHLRWSFLRKLLMAKVCSLFSQKNSIFDDRLGPKYASYQRVQAIKTTVSR